MTEEIMKEPLEMEQAQESDVILNVKGLKKAFGHNLATGWVLKTVQTS